MAIADDFQINYATQRIAYIGGGPRYSVRELYSWLMDTFDELGQMDDAVPMSAQTPTAFRFINGWTMADTACFQYLYGGAISDTTSNDLWSNLYTLGTIEAGTQVYIEQNGVELTRTWPTGHIDVLVRVVEGGTEIDGGNVTVYARELGDAYDFFPIDLSGGGRNAVPLATAPDLNNATSAGTLATYDDIAITFGDISRDLNNGHGPKTYAVEIDCAGRPLAQVYEYLKYVTRRGEAGPLAGVAGQFYQRAGEAFTPVKQAPFGTFAGGTFFGAQGVWITNYAVNQAFQLIASDGTTQTPPNIVYVEVTGLVSGDRVAVFRLDGVGGEIDRDRYTIAATTADAVQVTAPIAGDEPASGYLRLTGSQTVYTYTGISGDTFTGVSPSPAGVTGDAFVPFLDVEASGAAVSNSLIYSTDIPALVRVRQYGILPFEIEGLVTATGLSQAAIRTPDNIVT